MVHEKPKNKLVCAPIENLKNIDDSDSDLNATSPNCTYLPKSWYTVIYETCMQKSKSLVRREWNKSTNKKKKFLYGPRSRVKVKNFFTEKTKTMQILKIT